jgi:zinc protease
MNRTFKQSLLLVLAVTFFAAVSCFAQEQTAPKQTPPAGGPPKAFAVPAHETYSLPNGMQVTIVPYGNLPKVTLSLVMRSGQSNQPADKLGIARLTGELLKEGTATRTAKQIAEEAAQMGGAMEIGIGEDESSLDTDVLSESGPAAARLLADVARHPLLPESELSRLKTNALRQVAIARTLPQQIAAERFRKILYPDHAYGRILPTAESIQKLTIDDAKKFYADNIGAARAHLYVAGRFNTATMKKAIAEGFGDWGRGQGPAVDVPKVKAQRVLDVTDRPGAAQSTLFVGLPVADASSVDNIPLVVTNAILGGSFGSRITSNIREQKGYTYSPNSQISRRYRDAYWVEVADVTTAVTGPALKEIFAEIERLQKEAPGAEELAGIQRYLSGIFVIQNSSRQALIGQLRFVDLQGLGDDYLKTYVQKVNAVTPADVKRITAQYIKPEQMTIVVVGDKSKISEQLTPFAVPVETNK